MRICHSWSISPAPSLRPPSSSLRFQRHEAALLHRRLDQLDSTGQMVVFSSFSLRAQMPSHHHEHRALIAAPWSQPRVNAIVSYSANLPGRTAVEPGTSFPSRKQLPIFGKLMRMSDPAWRQSVGSTALCTPRIRRIFCETTASDRDLTAGQRSRCAWPRSRWNKCSLSLEV